MCMPEKEQVEQELIKIIRAAIFHHSLNKTSSLAAMEGRYVQYMGVEGFWKIFSTRKRYGPLTPFAHLNDNETTKHVQTLKRPHLREGPNNVLFLDVPLDYRKATQIDGLEWISMKIYESPKFIKCWLWLDEFPWIPSVFMDNYMYGLYANMQYYLKWSIQTTSQQVMFVLNWKWSFKWTLLENKQGKGWGYLRECLLFMG